MATTTAQDFLDETQQKLIGLIAAEWAMIEAVVSVAIWDYCKLDREQGLSVTADLGSLAKLNMVSALALNHFKADQATCAQFEAIITSLTNLNGARNSIVHNLWLPGFIANEMVAMKPSTKRGELTQSRITKTTPQLMDLYQKITVAKEEFEEFQKDHGVTPPSRPKP